MLLLGYLLSRGFDNCQTAKQSCQTAKGITKQQSSLREGFDGFAINDLFQVISHEIALTRNPNAYAAFKLELGSLKEMVVLIASQGDSGNEFLKELFPIKVSIEIPDDKLDDLRNKVNHDMETMIRDSNAALLHKILGRIGFSCPKLVNLSFTKLLSSEGAESVAVGAGNVFFMNYARHASPLNSIPEFLISTDGIKFGLKGLQGIQDEKLEISGGCCYR